MLTAESKTHIDKNQLLKGYFLMKKLIVLNSLIIIGIGVIIFGLFMKLVYRSNIGTDSEIAIYRLCNIALLVFNIINGFALVGAFLYPQLKVAGWLMDATGVKRKPKQKIFR